MVQNIQESIIRASELIKNSKYTVAFTGAGSSTKSGIPDFRSKGSGLWEKNDPYQVASLSAFKKHPEIFYAWIKPLYFQAKNAKPNASHTALATLESSGFVKAVITQNIDGLHQRAGSQNVIELHGTALTATCPDCSTSFQTEELLTLYIEENELPICDKCSHIIKPDVILFEEMLPQNAWEDAVEEIKKADVLIVVGSSLEVFPANSLPEIALHRGAKLIINTLSATQFDITADIVINADVTRVMPEIVEIVCS